MNPNIKIIGEGIESIEEMQEEEQTSVADGGFGNSVLPIR